MRFPRRFIQKHPCRLIEQNATKHQALLLSRRQPFRPSALSIPIVDQGRQADLREDGAKTIIGNGLGGAGIA
ncbi:hypothetical protein AA11825_2472 [Acetobacter pomorum DSM 11825]|nr:hypothetical protein AA11825_2472 [Acetobacter pomorum DSM 11825]